MERRIKIAIADDHRIFRDGIIALLSDYPELEIVAEAAEGCGLLTRLRSVQPDIALIDLTMPGMNGIELTAEIIKRYPDVKVLILSMHSENEFVLKSIQAGAKGYLPKDSSKEELLEAIHLVAGGEEYYSKSILNSFFRKYLHDEKTSHELIQNESLTQREIEILRLSASGYTNKEIAGKLNISVRTVDSHKNHIMTKLKLRNTAELVHYALRHGIIEI